MRIDRIRSRLVELPLEAPFRPAWGRGRVQSALVLVSTRSAPTTAWSGWAPPTAGSRRWSRSTGSSPRTCSARTRPRSSGWRWSSATPRSSGRRRTAWRSRCGTCSARRPGSRCTGCGAVPADGSARTARPASCAIRRSAPRTSRGWPTTGTPRSSSASTTTTRATTWPWREAVRAKVGDRIELMVDANQAGADPGVAGHRTWDFRTALHVARELERLGVDLAGGAAAALRLRRAGPAARPARHDQAGRRRGQPRAARVPATARAGLLRHPAARRDQVRNRLGDPPPGRVRRAARRRRRAAHLGQRARHARTPAPRGLADQLRAARVPARPAERAHRRRPRRDARHAVDHRRRWLRGRARAARLRLLARRGARGRAHTVKRDRKDVARVEDERGGTGRRRSARSRSPRSTWPARAPARCWSRSRPAACARATSTRSTASARSSPFPAVLGHEAAGTVVEAGPGVTRLRPGDPVIMSIVPSCGDCAYCRRGRPNYCLLAGTAMNDGTLFDGTRRLSRDGERTQPFPGRVVVRRVRGRARVRARSPSTRGCRSTGPRWSAARC